MTNPTSNFGWQMPTPTDLVTDLPADFEVFGQAVDTSMADLRGGTTGQILSKTTNTDMDFTWITNDVGDITAVNVTAPITGGGSAGAVTIGVSAASTAAAGVVQLSDSTSTTSSVLASTPTATKSAYDLADAAIAKSTVTTAGDIIYRNATVPTRLGIGTANQVLAVNSGATAPEWKTLPSSSVVQVKSANITTSQSTTSATFVDSTITLSITPTSASNNILVLVTVAGLRTETNDGGTKYGRVKLFRGASAIQNEGSPVGYYVGGGSGGTLIYEMYGSLGLSYIDSPATTSATTYKIQYKADNGTFTLAGNAAITLMEVTP
jgi:hypothetical protein